MQKQLNVLSLFDGMSCGQIALERAGFTVGQYFASEVDKHAIKVTQHNYPNTIQIGDVTKVRYEKGILYTENGAFETKIDLLIGGSPCFVAGTKVITSEGYKNIEAVKVGDSVLTHKNEFKKVLKTGGAIKETIIVKAQGVKPTETTREHPYYVRRMNRVWDNENRTSVRAFSEPEWKEAGKLEKGDFVGVNILTTCENKHNLTREDCWILGRYLADGHLRKSRRSNRKNSFQYQLILSIGSGKISDLAKNVKENHYSLYSHSNSVHRCVFSSMRLVNLVETLSMGIGAHNKRIPQEILDLPINLLESFLEGYLSGDGSFRDGEYRATSVSEELILGLSVAVAKVYRVNSSYEFTERPDSTVIEGRTVTQRNTFTLSFRKEMKKQSRAKVIGDIIWLPVISICETRQRKEVFNIEVADHNSYTANNAIVHNCQGFSFAGKQLNFDDPRSRLFFEYVRLLDETGARHFLLENVKMKKEFQDVITIMLGVDPIEINSALVSAQNRKRLYWTNIPDVGQPEDRGIFLKDIILDGEAVKEKSQTILATIHKENAKSMHKRDKHGLLVYQFPHGGSVGGVRELEKAPTLSQQWHNNYFKLIDSDKASAAVVANFFKGIPYNALKDWNCIRKFHPVECERLQTVPDGYTAHVSDTQRYRMLGNGWTVDVVAYIFSKWKNTQKRNCGKQ